uniref:CA domain-containing protein n=1 Tax=Steinernema glaseri TaxID=37863 RepID=A0A1I7ZMX2_9BILA
MVPSTLEGLLLALLLSLTRGCLLENDRSAVYVSVFEDLKIGEPLAELPVLGRSFGPDATIQLTLAPGQEDLVELDAAKKTLLLRRELDREKASKQSQGLNHYHMIRIGGFSEILLYPLTQSLSLLVSQDLTALLQGPNRLEVVVQCRSLDDKTFPQVNISTFVSVKDVNDNAPRFYQKSYRIEVPEELPNGTVVFVDFEADDDDQAGPNSFINYRITRGAEYLVIPSPDRPVVTVAGRIDFEKLRHFEAEIEASDSGSPQLRATVPLHVTVLDVDDQNPVFGSPSYYANSMEGNAFEILPEPIKAKDGDTLNASVQYELSGAHHESFTIDSEGIVRLVNDSHVATTLLVHAYETERPERRTTAMLRIAEQSSIEFEHSLYSIRLTSSMPVDAELLRVKATSSSGTARLRYSILNDEGAVLRVEERTGRIFLRSPLTAEKYAFKISATDGKTRGWSRLELSVDQSNSHLPEFDQPEYFLEMKNANLIGQVRATDEDSGDTVVYRLLNFHSMFEIDEDGMLSRRSAFSSSFDLNRQPDVYELVVLAEDTVGHRQFVSVVVTALHGTVISTTALLAVGIFALLIVLFVIIVYTVIRRCVSCFSRARRNKVCWMSKTGDNGVVLSGSVPTEIESRTVSSSSSSKFPTSDEKDRDAMDVYATTSVASPSRVRGAHLVPVTVATARGGPPTIYF